MAITESYIFAVISDGAGCSKCAKDAAWCTVNAVIEFCRKKGSEFFNQKAKLNAKKMIFEIQQALFEKASCVDAEFSQMKSTLILLCLNRETKQYTAVHIGDGLIAKCSKQNSEIISYPENGPTKQFTYMVNSPNVFRHLRVGTGLFCEGDCFLLGSDGVFEECYSTNEYIFRIKELDTYDDFDDDTTYCKITI